MEDKHMIGRCIYCGKEFQARRKSNILCSKRCRDLKCGRRERRSKKDEDPIVIAALLARDNGDRSKLDALLKERMT